MGSGRLTGCPPFPYPVSRLHPSADRSFQSPFCAVLSCFCRFRSFILPFTFPGIPFFLKLLRHSAAPLCKHLVGNLSHLSAFPVSICPHPFLPELPRRIRTSHKRLSVRRMADSDKSLKIIAIRKKHTPAVYRFGSCRTSCRSSSFFTTTPTKGRAFRMVSAGIPPICRAFTQSISSEVLGFLRMSRIARIL